MNFTKNGIELKIDHNKSNRLWKPIGIFINPVSVKYKNEWYKCRLNFVKEKNKHFLIINTLYNDAIPPGSMNDIQIKFQISSFNRYYLEYKQGLGKINHQIFDLKKTIHKRRWTYLVLCIFIITFLILHYNISVVKEISNNEVFLVISLLLGLLGLISFFIPIPPIFNLKHQEKEKERQMKRILEEHERKQKYKARIEKNRF